jgi:hypothetical protein
VVIGRRGGKTELALNEIIKKSIQSPNLYWYLGPYRQQVKTIAWTRLKYLLKNDPAWVFNEVELSAYHPSIDTRIELKGTDNEESLRGRGLGGVVFDESATIKPSVWKEVVRPMLADVKGWAIFIGTPKGRNWFYDLFVQNDPEWQSWHYPTSVNAYIAKDEIERAKKDMPERLFKQEFQAEFLDDETGIFRKIRQCVVGDFKEPILGRFYVIGVDLARTYDFTVLTVIDSITREVVAFERFQDISWTEQKLRIQKLAGKYNNALVILDSSGVGDPIYEDLWRANISVDSYKFTNESKTKLIEQLCISIEQRLITFPRIEELIYELTQYEYSITNEGRIKYSAPEGKHDDCVISLALANWGIKGSVESAEVAYRRMEEAEVRDRQGQGERVGGIQEENPYINIR